MPLDAAGIHIPHVNTSLPELEVRSNQLTIFYLLQLAGSLITALRTQAGFESQQKGSPWPKLPEPWEAALQAGRRS